MELTVENLELTRGELEIVSQLSFQLSAGEALVVTGENGSGKSTTLRGIAGLHPLTKGSVTLRDENGKVFEGHIREYCHYLGHENGMKGSLTVRENLKFWQEFFGDQELTIEQALDEVDLAHAIDLPFSYLSAGQKRRAAIAKLLVSDRPIWVLDEPTAGLDAGSVKIFSSLAKVYCDSGGILIAATHLPLGIKKAKKLEIGV